MLYFSKEIVLEQAINSYTSPVVYRTLQVCKDFGPSKNRDLRASVGEAGPLQIGSATILANL